MSKKLTRLEEHYNAFVKEAQEFFVTRFIDSDRIKKTYMDCIDIIFNISGTIDKKGVGLITFNKNYGQGKTFLFDVINHIWKRKNGYYYFIKITAKELAELFTETGNDEHGHPRGGEKALKTFVECKNLLIDDIGDEGDKKVFKHYSNELNVIRWVILKRYEQWINAEDLDKRFRLFGSTNLTNIEIAQEYGGRAADRLKQMCHTMDFSFLGNKKSFRNFDGTRPLNKDEIKKSWAKYAKPKKVEKWDTLGYMNSLLKEDDKYLALNDWIRWRMVKNFLLARDLIKLDNIPIEDLELAKKLAVEDESDNRSKLRRFMEAKSMIELTDVVKKKQPKHDVIEIAQALYAKRVFIELTKKKNFVFK